MEWRAPWPDAPTSALDPPRPSPPESRPQGSHSPLPPRAHSRFVSLAQASLGCPPAVEPCLPPHGRHRLTGQQPSSLPLSPPRPHLLTRTDTYMISNPAHLSPLPLHPSPRRSRAPLPYKYSCTFHMSPAEATPTAPPRRGPQASTASLASSSHATYSMAPAAKPSPAGWSGGEGGGDVNPCGGRGRRITPCGCTTDQ